MVNLERCLLYSLCKVMPEPTYPKIRKIRLNITTLEQKYHCQKEHKWWFRGGIVEGGLVVYIEKWHQYIVYMNTFA